MATIAQNYNDEEENQQAPGAPTNIAGTGGAGSGGTGQGGAATVSPVKQNQGAQANQGYTDVASYLNANQGGSQKLGEQAASNLTNKYNQTKQGATDSYNQFQGNVNQGYVKENSDLINQVAGNATSAANDPNQLSAFQAQLNDTYTGPQNWADFGTQQGKVNEANQYASLAGTPGGLNVYSQEIEGQTGGPQSQGINQLDTLLLGGDSNAIGQVQGAANQYKDLNDFINAQNMKAGQEVTGAQTSAQNASQHALDAFTGANGTLTNLNQSVNTNASKQLTDAQARQADIAKNLGMVYNGSSVANAGAAPENIKNNYSINQNALSDQNLADLGLSRDQWNSLNSSLQKAGTSDYKTGHNFGASTDTAQLDLLAGLTQADPTQRFTAANTATPEQYAQMAAIQKLLGSKTPQGNALNPEMADQAGTASLAGLNQFDLQGAQQYADTFEDQSNQGAQSMADFLTQQANAAHDAGKGGFLKKLTDVAKIANPTTYVANKGLLDLGKKFKKS